MYKCRESKFLILNTKTKQSTLFCVIDCVCYSVELLTKVLVCGVHMFKQVEPGCLLLMYYCGCYLRLL